MILKPANKAKKSWKGNEHLSVFIRTLEKGKRNKTLNNFLPTKSDACYAYYDTYSLKNSVYLHCSQSTLYGVGQKRTERGRSGLSLNVKGQRKRNKAG